MSTDTSNNNNTPDDEAENNAPSAPSNKDKFVGFVKKNAKPIAAISGVILLIIIVVIIYNSFSNRNMNKLAEDFCSCVSVPLENPHYYADSKDGFGYRSDLVGCFAKDFRAYGKDYDKATKRALLLKFQEEVTKKCPEKLAGVFEYK